MEDEPDRRAGLALKASCTAMYGFQLLRLPLMIKQYIIPATTIVVECEEGTDINQALIDLLYVGAQADDEKTKFRVMELDLGKIFPMVESVYIK